jgi:hypothetical protein
MIEIVFASSSCVLYTQPVLKTVIMVRVSSYTFSALLQTVVLCFRSMYFSNKVHINQQEAIIHVVILGVSSDSVTAPQLVTTYTPLFSSQIRYEGYMFQAKPSIIRLLSRSVSKHYTMQRDELL